MYIHAIYRMTVVILENNKQYIRSSEFCLKVITKGTNVSLKVIKTNLKLPFKIYLGLKK